jgi:hypothetical protein
MIGGQRRRIRIEDALASVSAFHNRRTLPCNLNPVNNCRAYDYMTMANRQASNSRDEICFNSPRCVGKK